MLMQIICTKNSIGSYFFQLACALVGKRHSPTPIFLLYLRTEQSSCVNIGVGV